MHAPSPDPRAAARYDVAVLAFVGSKKIESTYALATAPAAGDVWTFTTLWSAGVLEDGPEAVAYDSRTPRPSDPWPAVQTQAISAVSTAVHVDSLGRPSALVDEAGWVAAARAALDAAGLPPEARAAGEPLVDPAGALADLQRLFPGAPPEEGPWSRAERIAGLPATRTETCVRADGEKGAVTWTCDGTLTGPAAGGARLVDGTSRTVLTIDRRGLVEVDCRWSATLVRLAASGAGVVDQPVAGRRWVHRAAEEPR